MNPRREVVECRCWCVRLKKEAWMRLTYEISWVPEIGRWRWFLVGQDVIESEPSVGR